jgi:mRNA interferase MazF
MGTFAAGSVVLIPFPFSDLSGTKVRPALVLATLDKGDCILCQITSQPYNLQAIELGQQDFAEGSLSRTSYIKPGKLFTAHESLLQREVGKVAATTLQTVRQHVVKIILGN